MAEDKPGEARIDISTCESYRIIDLAVAYDSSFCASYGGRSSNADNHVASLVSMVSSRYNQKGLCAKIKLSHLEGYCDPESDPYKQYVDLNSSGCVRYGLLDHFQEYWNANRSFVHRDTAHLFTGTPLECTNGGCIVGCTVPSSRCIKSVAYGLNHVGQTYSPTLSPISNVSSCSAFIDMVLNMFPILKKYVPF